MLSIMKLCYYQIRGRGVLYGLTNGILFILILVGAYGKMRRGTLIIDEENLRLMLGAFIPFFSCFMILPFAEEIMNTDFEETNFLFRNKIDFLFLIQNTVYYFNILIVIFFYGRMYTGILNVWYQIYFLCIYLQLFAFVGYIITRSNFAVCGIIFVYLGISLFFSHTEDQELTIGYLAAFGDGMKSFFKEQGWKTVIAVLAVVLYAVGRKYKSSALIRGSAQGSRHGG